MFQPRGPNFFLSRIITLKKQRPNISLRHVMPRSEDREREGEREKEREREREMFHNVSNVLLVLFCMMDQTGQQDQESMDADQLYNFLKEKTNDDIAECLKKNEITGKNNADLFDRGPDQRDAASYWRPNTTD